MEDMKFTCEWTACLLQRLNRLRSEGNDKRGIESALGECSSLCFERNQFAQKIKKYESTEDFIQQFCIPVLGWECEYDKSSGTIVCLENNKECLCPVVKTIPNISEIICCCTQGEIKRIFRYGLEVDVEVEIVDSWVKNGKSCVYKIKLK